MIRLDIGCRTQRRDVIGIDPYIVSKTGVKADLNVGLPLKDNCVDEIYAYHVLEHAQDLVAAMQELWRVCKEGSLVYIRVPHASSPYVTWVDPSHRRGLTIETFASFAINKRTPFELEYARLHFITAAAKGRASPLRRLLADVLEALANHSRTALYRCERWWGPWVGFDEAFVILRAVKVPLPQRRLKRERRNGTGRFAPPGM
jgi:SAM-dependent methyltransferase